MTNKTIKSLDLRYILIAAWLTFTVALSSWWIYFGYQQNFRLIAVRVEGYSDFVRYQKMFFWEGTTLIICLLLGGAALTYYVFRETRQRHKLKQFFATFTHELRTPLSAVQLQGEIIKERIQDPALEPLLVRLLNDLSRLNLQLENSLFLANIEKQQFFVEDLILSEVLATVRNNFPNLEIELLHDVRLKADRRALHSILNNLAQNSLIHGKATRLTINSKSIDKNGRKIQLNISDNGAGIQAPAKDLCKLFKRQYSGSGSGIGLFLAKQLIEGIGGKFRIIEKGPGFCVEFELNGSLI